MKRTLIAVTLVFALVILGFGVFCALDDPNARPIHPVESRPNQILLTSNACCGIVYDLQLTLHDKKTNEKHVLCTAEEVSDFDVLQYKIPKLNVEEFELVLTCDVLLGDTYLFDKSILLGNDFETLRKSGLLIYLQEADGMYINVITANRHDTYRLMEDNQAVWELQDEPNQVFAVG